MAGTRELCCRTAGRRDRRATRSTGLRRRWPRAGTFASRRMCGGSTGYGMEFQRANVKDLGGGDLEDEVYAAKFMTATGFVDSTKIGITGGSYGGENTLMAGGAKKGVGGGGGEVCPVLHCETRPAH